MATRAPKGTSRTRGGTAHRTREASTTRGRSAAATRGGRGNATNYRRRKGRTPVRKSNYRRNAPPSKPTNPFVILAGWIVSALAGIYMGLAHTVGSAARLVGQSARDLDPLHRRDGIGLAALCAAVITAAASWWNVAGQVHPVQKFLVAFCGSGSWTVPLLLGLVAWRFLRHPDNNAATARMIIGWSALLIGALGLAHVASGTPRFSGGMAGIRSGGGLIGASA